MPVDELRVWNGILPRGTSLLLLLIYYYYYFRKLSSWRKSHVNDDGEPEASLQKIESIKNLLKR